MSRRIFLSFLIFLVYGSFFGAELEYNVSVSPEVVALGEGAEISVEVNKKVRDVIPPKGTEFDIQYAGISQQSYVSIVNGKVTSKQSIVYRYICIPRKTGLLTIPAFKIIDENGKSFESNPLKLKVEKRQKIRQRTTDPFEELEELLIEKRKIPIIMLKFRPYKQKVYQNEPLVVDLILISDRKEAFDYSYQEISPLRTDKAIFYDISSSIEKSIPISSGGYYEKVVKRYVFYPTEKGVLGIAPPGIVAITPYGQIQLKSENLGVEVLPLGSGEGVNYVGDLSIKSEISTNSILLGDTIKLKLTLEGNGNLKIFSNIFGKLNIDGIFISQEKMNLEFEKFLNNRPYFKGEIVFSIIPQRAGSFVIPPVEIFYFDRNIVKRKITLPSYTINVNAKDTLQISREKFVFKKVDLNRKFRFILLNPFVIFYIALMFTLPLFGFIYNNFQLRLKTDEKFRKKFFASKKLSRYLIEAENHLKKENYKEFYISLQKGLFYYLCDKLDIPLSTDFKQVIEKLAEKNVEETALKKIKEIYTQCQFAYSGKIIKENAGQLLAETKNLIENLKI